MQQACVLCSCHWLPLRLGAKLLHRAFQHRACFQEAGFQTKRSCFAKAKPALFWNDGAGISLAVYPPTKRVAFRGYPIAIVVIGISFIGPVAACEITGDYGDTALNYSLQTHTELIFFFVAFFLQRLF